MKRLSLLLLCLLIHVNTLAGIYGYYPSSRLYLGAGHNPYRPVDGFVKCIEHDGISQEDTSGAVSTEVQLRTIKSRKDLYNYLNVSTSMSGGTAFYSGNFSMNLVDESAFHSDSLSWMIMFRSDYGNFSLKNPRLKERYKKMNSDRLYKSCGSEVVIEGRKGAMVFAILTVKNLSSSRRKELEMKMSLSMKGSFWSADMSAAYNSVLKTSMAMTDVSVAVKTVGGNGMQDLADIIGNGFTDYQQLPKIMNKYVREVSLGNSSPLRFVTAHMSAFKEGLDLEYESFKSAQAAAIFEKYEDALAVTRRLDDMLFGPDSELYFLSDKEFDELSRAHSEYSELVNSLYNSGRSCFDVDSDDKCLLGDIGIKRVKWGEVTKSYRCDQMRRDAYSQGLLPLGLLKMARDHEIFPVVEQLKVVGFEKCSLLI